MFRLAALALLLLLVSACTGSSAAPGGSEPAPHPGYQSLTVTVMALPTDDPVDLTRPVAAVAGAVVAVTETGTRATTDQNGQARLEVPLGDHWFTVTPPPGSPLKPARYREKILANGTLAFSFALSPGGELTIDHTQAQAGSGGPPLAKAGTPILSQLCSGVLRPYPEAELLALVEITAAVRAAGEDTTALERRLAELAANRWADPAVTRADLDGDRREDRIITFGWCQTPAILYRAADPGTAFPVPRTAENAPTWSPGGGTKVEQVADVNGDGRAELVVTALQAGASAGHTFLYIYRWNGDGFDILFTDHLSNWIGPNDWRVGDGSVSIQCRPLGPYEGKMMEHRQQTELFRWDPARGGYVLAERVIAPVPSRILQVSAAELLFQQGDFAAATEQFRRVGDLPVLNPRPDDPDWIAYAHLRLGQIAALSGRPEDALTELEQATRGANPVAEAAARFRDGYRQSGPAAGFEALWAWVRRTAFAPDTADVLTATWPYLLDPHTLGARPVMAKAFALEGRPLLADLPGERAWEPADCLKVSW